MIVSFINLKGGCGKTTSCIATASAAARAGKDVAVYDTDPQSSATEWVLNIEEEEGEAPFAVDSANKGLLRKRVSKFQGDPGKWAFIDCPPSGDIVDVAKDVSDFVVVPTTPATADLSKAIMTAESLTSFGCQCAILMTRTTSRTITLRAALEELKEKDLSYFSTMIPDREALRRLYGKSFGDDLFRYDEVFKEIEEALA